MDKSIMEAKAADEAKLRASYKADPKNAGVADPWDADRAGHEVAARHLFSAQLSGAPARALPVRIAARSPVFWYVRQRKNPSPTATGCVSSAIPALPSLEQQLFSTAPVYKSLDTALLTDSLAEMQDDARQRQHVT